MNIKESTAESKEHLCSSAKDKVIFQPAGISYGNLCIIIGFKMHVLEAVAAGFCLKTVIKTYLHGSEEVLGGVEISIRTDVKLGSKAPVFFLMAECDKVDA